MTKLFTLFLILISAISHAQNTIVPEYGKLLLVEHRPMQPHFEWGAEGGPALDNTTEDVYSLNLILNYIASPLYSFGVEGTLNRKEDKDYLKKLQKSNEVKITSYTPDIFSQATVRVHLIKGHLNLLNKYHSPFEMTFVLGAGMGYNTEQSKSSSLISWGGEFIVPLTQKLKGTLGVRHYKSYAFQNDELRFTSLLAGIRSEF